MNTNTFNAFVAINAQLKTVTTRKRLAKNVLGSRHPITSELRGQQRILRAQRAELALELGDIVFIGQDASPEALVAAHGVDEGAYVEELLTAAAEMGADDAE
jgi:hypothetical protein